MSLTARDAWVVFAFVLAVPGGSVFVGAVLRSVVRPGDRHAVEAFRKRGLQLGGTIIGALERSLVLTFVLSGDFSAIGLILAAKGLLRFPEIKDAKDQKVAEYVLIGTMLSMLWAVLVGLAVQRFVPAAA